MKAPDAPFALFSAQTKIREAQKSLEDMQNLNIVSQAYIEEMKHTTENLLDDPITHLFDKVTGAGQTLIRRVLDFFDRLVLIAIMIVIGLLSFYVVINKMLDKCLSV